MTSEISCTITKEYNYSSTATFSLSISEPEFVDCRYEIQAIAEPGLVSAYTYSWNTGARASRISVTTGEYSVTVTDEDGCSQIETIDIEVPDNDLKMELSVVDNYSSRLDFPIRDGDLIEVCEPDCPLS